MNDILIFKIDIGDELSMLNCRNIHTELLEKASHYEKIIIDMSDIKYIDSSGINVLLSLTKIKPNNIGVFGLNEQPKEILNVTGIFKRINVFDTKEEALNAFK